MKLKTYHMFLHILKMCACMYVRRYEEQDNVVHSPSTTPVSTVVVGEVCITFTCHLLL